MAPFTPFFTESLYQNLRKALPADEPESVHFCSIPEGTEPREADKHIHQVRGQWVMIALGGEVPEYSHIPAPAISRI